MNMHGKELEKDGEERMRQGQLCFYSFRSCNGAPPSFFFLLSPPDAKLLNYIVQAPSKWCELVDGVTRLLV